jgi:GNAT superfamily N-acetyltransferase
MYTHPSHTHRGIGRMVIAAGEDAARANGFRSVELAATMAGKPFYLKCGYTVDYEWLDDRAAEAVPLAKMTKSLVRT